MNGKTAIWQQASQLIEGLEDLDESEAWAQIDDASELDPLVKAAAKKLLELSSSDDTFAAFIEHPLPYQTFAAGDTLGGYQLLEMVGEGGMAAVYRATRLDTDIQKDVAIKVINHNRLPPSLLKQFVNEQQILSRLDHPNIVSMHHNGITENGTSYIAMDYIKDAVPIDDFVANTHLNLKQIITIIRTIADALSYAHANLIIHRDIKPSNILVNATNDIKIVDFGIAKLLDQQDDSQTQTLIALTPNYAAPEQIKHNQVSVQTDIFSLGAVFLHLLTQQKPLPDERLLNQCANDESWIASQLKSLNVDQDIKNILNKALQSDPKRRYKTMQSFTDDLWRWEHNRPVFATPDSLWYRLQKFSKRRKPLFASMVTLSISLTIGISALLWQIQQTQKEANKANAVKDFMLNTYAVVDPDVNQGSDITAKNLLTASHDEIMHDQTMDDEVRFELLQTMGQANAQLGDHETAIKIFNEALLIRPNDPAAQVHLFKATVSNGQYTEGKALLAQMNHSASLSTALQAQWLRAQVRLHSNSGDLNKANQVAEQLKSMAVTGTEWVQNQLTIAEMYFDQSEPTEAIQLLEQTLSKHQTQFASTNTTLMKLKYSLSSMYGTVGEPQKAHDILTQLLADQAEILGESHPAYVTTLVALASANRALGQMPEALNNAQQAYDLSVKNKGENHLDSANALQMLGALTAVIGDYPKAVELFTESVRVFELNTGPENPNALDIKTDIGMLLGRMGEHEKSLEMLEQVYAQQLNRLGPGHRSTIYVQMNLGLTHSYLEHHEQAIEIETNALQAANEHLGEKHPISVNVLYALGRVYRSAEQHQNALETMLQIEHKELLNPNDEKMAPYTKMVSRVYRSLNLIPEAITYGERSLQLNKDIYGEDSRAVADARLFLAELLLSSGNHDEGLALIETTENMTVVNDDPQDPINQQIQILKEQYL